MRYRLSLFILSCLFLLTAFSHSQSGASRVKYNFNSGRKVLVGNSQGADQPGFDDSQWKQVTTPYAWNEDSAFRVSIHDLPTGVAWYRKHFRLPARSARHSATETCLRYAFAHRSHRDPGARVRSHPGTHSSRSSARFPASQDGPDRLRGGDLQGWALIRSQFQSPASQDGANPDRWTHILKQASPPG